MKKFIFFSFIGLSFISCGNNPSAEENNTDNIYAKPPINIAYTITNVYPHDVNSFTEGLEFKDGFLYESGGDYGKSKLAKVELTTGKDIQRINFPDKNFFGEGITILNGKLYQLTYKQQICTVYDVKTFKKLNEFNYEGEGWGMTNDGKQIIMDNGSNDLYYRDPETFKVIKTVGVIDNNGAVANINELEFIDGFVYASMYTMSNDKIIKIDPTTGKVVGTIDFNNVLAKYAKPEEYANRDVCNGIAYDSTQKRFFITGKNWPKLFEIKLN
jgi:glutamine cyclotransferase